VAAETDGDRVSALQMLPPMARTYSPADTIPVRHLHQSIGKSKKPIVVVRWTPEGRRLLTGGHTGEFMLWNGTAFNFETVMDVRDTKGGDGGDDFANRLDNHRRTTIKSRQVSHLSPGLIATSG
jgi:hypothetical protein